MNEINVALARKLLTVIDAGLTSGQGEPVPGKMCVEAAVCHALGLPHGDNPPCVASAVRRFKIRLNDAMWSSNAARAAGMRKVAVGQLGSAGVIDEGQFARVLACETIRVVVPIALRAAAKMNQAHAAKLEEAAAKCEQQPNRASAEAARAVAIAAAAAAAARDLVLSASAEACFTALRECSSPSVALWDQIAAEDAA